MRALPLAAVLLVSTAASAPDPSASLKVEVQGLRNHKGAVMYCLTRRTNQFLECRDDPGSLRRMGLAGSGAVSFDDVSPGDYALLVLHDANRNGKLDKRFGIPREGFGFSNNPAIRFGPPNPAAVRFQVPAGTSRQVVKLKYML